MGDVVPTLHSVLGLPLPYWYIEGLIIPVLSSHPVFLHKYTSDGCGRYICIQVKE